MSRSWVIPRWWPKNRLRQAIVGLKVECWFFPELDQWTLSWHWNCYGRRILAVGPFRLAVETVGINRQHAPIHSSPPKGEQP